VLDRVEPGEVQAPYSDADIVAEFDATVAFWRGWLSRSRHSGRWREMVHRSALTLKLLTYAPTGAIVAAPTTSLPEEELADLEGYRGSAPVRIGNRAASQLQLDIYGELMDSVYLCHKYGLPIYHDGWIELTRNLRWLMDHWDQPDEGIWEAPRPSPTWRRSAPPTTWTANSGERQGARAWVAAPGTSTY
jgi:GH15 family glucan-1,4-alpha-glucosidase